MSILVKRVIDLIHGMASTASLFGHIDGKRFRRAARRRGWWRGCRLKGVLAAGYGRDAGALRGKSLRNGAAQSAAGTGDERDLAFEIT